MKYWWVNHKQTFNKEINGSYLWSPKVNKNGRKNVSYTNMTIVQPGDGVISYADGKIKAIGLVSHSHFESPKPDFGNIGTNWSNTGWQVPVAWSILEASIMPKQHLSVIAPLLPTKYSPIQDNGNGNQGIYLAEIRKELWDQIMIICSSHNSDITVDLAVSNELIRIETEVEKETEKEQLVKSRSGQGVFRKKVKSIEKACRVTGVANESLLIASHIKPWRDSNNKERLDGNNGLFLSPHIDQLFDKGFISFTNDGDLMISNALSEEVLKKWHLSKLNVGGFNRFQKIFLKYHRESIFQN